MAHGVYHSGQFARRASVSVRTLRHYDRMGLLQPGRRTDAGYRLYSDDDLLRLQQILALKFLGFSLEEIRTCLRCGPQGLPDVLGAQKAMMREKRNQIDTIIRALEATERVVQEGCSTWESIVDVVEALQMDQKDEWQSRYFTPEQREALEVLDRAAYSDEARQALAARGPWTEEDQRGVDARYAWIAAELRRLVAAGADPASDEAQAVVRVQRDLLAAFTQGDPRVESGLQEWWRRFRALPRDQRPVQLPYSDDEATFLGRATDIYDARLAEDGPR